MARDTTRVPDRIGCFAGGGQVEVERPHPFVIDRRIELDQGLGRHRNLDCLYQIVCPGLANGESLCRLDRLQAAVGGERFYQATAERLEGADGTLYPLWG
jgi:hypothetical protein